MSADLPPTYTQEPSEADVQLSDDSDLSFVSAHDEPPPIVAPPSEADVDDVDADQFTINGHETVFPDREKTLATFGDVESYSDHDHH